MKRSTHKGIILVASIFASVFLLAIVALMIIGTIAPETCVYHGHQLPEKYKDEIRSLDLLEPGEEIAYFYTDGFLDIKEGFYYVSDRHLVIYSSQWEDPASIIDFEDIIYLDATFDDSFLNDSFIEVSTNDGMEYWFPVSSEKGLDKTFFNYLKEQTDIPEVSLEEMEVDFEEQVE